MGNASGTYTQKAVISSQLYPFSKWDRKEIQQFLSRGQVDLSESFGLRKHEFEFLIGINEEISFQLIRSLFEDIFDTDHNSLVDKMEIMCVLCMISKISTEEKLQFFFELFNFNNKGFLNDSELTLLFIAVTRGIFKVDQKFFPPSAKVIKELVKDALTFAITEPGRLRKPELLRFAVNNPAIYAYLECWRGHAAQVLLLDGTKWRDLSFPCDASAIAWNYSWGILGLPPPNFIHWRRIDKIGTEVVASHLFAHEVTFLKTIDRKKVYHGSGILGKGYLKQGCLADLWFLNGLSALISNPELLFALFGETGQEENGRYCCRFYEGGSWRSVYVDDRIPCLGTLSPAFASSSCPFEYWPLIIEKAMAKYLGSYGHIAWCSDRTDASMMGLRMLTGGHVKRFYLSNYDWKSVILESVKESGTQLVLEAVKKGHVVCFVRSAAQSMMNISLKQNKSSLNLLPVGHFFPVIGHLTNPAGFVYFIFKDTWGLVADASEEANAETGRCKTFKIKVEDIEMFFDCFILSYYPDSLRAKAPKLGIKQWITEAASAFCTSSFNSSRDQEVAKFILKVKKSSVQEKIVSANQNRFKSKHDIINETLQDANGLATISSQITVPRLKEKASFMKETDRPMPGMSKTEVPKGQKAIPSGYEKPHDEFDDDVISLAFTASSSYDWSYSGSHEAQPTMKVRIIPSQDTKNFIRNREEEIIQRKKVKEEYFKKRRLAQAQLLEINTFGEEDVNKFGDQVSLTSSVQSGAGGGSGIVSGEMISEDSASLLYRNPLEVEGKQYELYFSAQRSWISQNIDLIEGEYLILIDISFAQPLKEIKKRSLPRDLSEAPWIDYQLATLLQHEHVVDQFHTEKYTGKLFEQDDDTRSLQSLKELEKRLFSDNKHQYESSQIDGNNNNGQTTELFVPSNLEELMENKILFECSSHDELKLRPFDGKRKQKQKKQYEIAEPLFPEEVQRETWPLICESQLEVASSKLTEMMTDLMMESQYLAEEFISIARKYKEEKKLEVVSGGGMKNKGGKGGLNSATKESKE